MNFVLKWGGPNKVILQSNGIWCNLSIIFNEFVLSNDFSFEYHHHRKDPYISIFPCIYIYIYIYAMTSSLLELLKAIYWSFKRYKIFRNMCSEAWPASATLLSTNALKWWPCRGPLQSPEPFVLCSAHLCYGFFSRKCETTLLKIFTCRTFCDKYLHKP